MHNIQSGWMSFLLQINGFFLLVKGMAEEILMSGYEDRILNIGLSKEWIRAE